jgi:hypothetical protein
MNRDRVIDLFPDANITNVQFVDNNLGIRAHLDEDKITLEGHYTPEQIEALNWYLQHRDQFTQMRTAVG